MSSLIFNPTVVADDRAEPEATIRNDGWFPDVKPSEIRSEQRIKDSVTFERLRSAVQGAMITLYVQLERWCAARCDEGHASLEAVPARKLGDDSQLVILYRRALGATVRADLIEGYRDVDLTNAGQRDVNELDPSIGELRRTAIHAIRDMLGVGRTNIELI